MGKAINEDNVLFKGFYAWSLMDNYEWEMGFTERFGMMYDDFTAGVDENSPNADTPVYNPHDGTMTRKCGQACVRPQPLSNGQTRHAKNSLLWMMQIWKTNQLPDPMPYLASTEGGDICYGHGTYTVNNQVGKCTPGEEDALRIVV